MRRGIAYVGQIDAKARAVASSWLVVKSRDFLRSSTARSKVGWSATPSMPQVQTRTHKLLTEKLPPSSKDPSGQGGAIQSNNMDIVMHHLPNIPLVILTKFRVGLV